MMRCPILALALAALVLAGCDTLRDARTGAADLALGEATGECRQVRAEALVTELAALWPGRDWSAAREAVDAYGPRAVDLWSDAVARAVYVELVPVLAIHGVDVGRSVLADGLDGIVDAARDLPGVADAVGRVRAETAECEAGA